MRLDILLALYNSEKYLRPQLDSIFGQSYRDWRLLVRDGGSSDGTMAIIAEYARRYPGKIEIVPAVGRSRAPENFSALMNASDADWLCFADHDDEWLPDKLAKELALMAEMEAQYGRSCPIALHHDMIVCDEELRPVALSRMKLQKMSPLPAPNVIIVEANIYGCTMMFNRALADLAGRIPSRVSHDNWLALIAAFTGKIGYLDEALLRYRRHRSNVSQFASYTYSFPAGIKYALNFRKIREDRYRFYVDPVKELVAVGPRTAIPDHLWRMLFDFSRFEEYSWFRRKYCMLRYRIHMTGLLRSIALFCIM